jgi:Ala-tRNA(Pro) deacylase
MEKVEQFLNKIGVKFRLVQHAAVFTVGDLVDELKDERPVKNLLLRDAKKRMFLVVAYGDKKIDLRELATTLGSARLSFASPERLKEFLGVAPGSVSIFGLLNDKTESVRLVLDEDLFKGGEVGFHPNDNTKTVFVDSSAVAKIAKALTSDYQVLPL